MGARRRGTVRKMWVALFSALAGALIGGTASAVGSAWVARSTARRAARAEILSDVLPGVFAVRDGSADGVLIERAENLRRHAVIAGRTDAHMLDQLRDLVIKLESARGNGVASQETQQAREALTACVDDYAVWVQMKLLERFAWRLRPNFSASGGKLTAGFRRRPGQTDSAS